MNCFWLSYLGSDVLPPGVTMIDSVSDGGGLQERDGTGATAPCAANTVREVSTHDQPRLSYRARLFEQLQTSWKSLYAFSAKLVAIFPIALIAALLVRDVTQRSINIEPISVPKTLNDDGYAPTVAAQKLRDDLNEIIAEAQTTTKQERFAKCRPQSRSCRTSWSTRSGTSPHSRSRRTSWFPGSGSRSIPSPKQFWGSSALAKKSPASSSRPVRYSGRAGVEDQNAAVRLLKADFL
jgi:hypothetical protein